MVAHLRNALDLLDEQGRTEVLQFIFSQQNPDGGFQDRGGRSDLYYSLFGMLILNGSPLNPPKGDLEDCLNGLHQLRYFVNGQSKLKIPGFMEMCCLALLQKQLKTGCFLRIKTLAGIGSSFWKERYSINLSYRSFVLFLTLDAIIPFPGFLMAGAKKMMSRSVIDENSPCSEVAAKLFLQTMMSQNCAAEQNLLLSFACDSGGFKAFAHLQQADMLSTAVALFSLNYSGYDLRMQKPVCLGFIQQNFSEGAFLSGDGDQTRDVEYTFYGLLALGVLVD